MKTKMKKHIKIYIDYFGYAENDFIPSEISGKPAVDIHHIQFGAMGRKNNIENLIAVTREEHIDAHENKLTKEELQKIHNKNLR